MSENAGDTLGANLSDGNKYHHKSLLTANVKGFNGDEYEISAAQNKLQPNEKYDPSTFRPATQIVTATGGAPHHHERLLAALHQGGWKDAGFAGGARKLIHPTLGHTAYVRQTGNKSHIIVYGGDEKDKPHNHVHRMMHTMAKTLTGEP